MYTRLLLPLLGVLLPLWSVLSAQSYTGLRVDNYAGVHGLLLNPAAAADSRTGFELQLGSVSGLLSSDYAKLDGSLLRDALDTDADQAILERDARNDNYGFANVDIVGPSLFMRLGDNTGLGLITRARGMYNLTNTNGGLFEGIQSDFGAYTALPFQLSDSRSTMHLWGEASLVLGTVLVRSDDAILKAGGAVKYLQGLGSVYTSSAQLNGAYDRQQDRVDLAGDMSFGRTTGFDLESIDPANRTSGMGFDAGIAYEWSPGGKRDSSAVRRPYRLKAAVSVVDIGSIGYEGSTRTDYLLSGSLPADRVEGAGSTEDILEEFDGTTTQEAVDVGLPTTLHFLVDVRLTDALYVSGLYSTSLVDETKVANAIPTLLTLVPRIETRGLGLTFPITLRQGQPTTFGAGVRLGPFMIGSSSLISHYLMDGAYAADVYAGVKFGFQRKREK